jgi:hypothetical protein
VVVETSDKNHLRTKRKEGVWAVFALWTSSTKRLMHCLKGWTLHELDQRAKEIARRRPGFINDPDIDPITDHFWMKGHKEGFSYGVGLGVIWTLAVVLWYALGNAMSGMEEYKSVMPLLAGASLYSGHWLLRRAWRAGDHRS